MRRLTLSLLACLIALVPRSVEAQIAFGAVAAAAAGTTSVAPAYPASIAAGDLLVLCVTNKYPTNGPSTPADWTAVTNGQGNGGDGTPGVDTGDVYSTVFVKVATGSESGTLTVTVTSGNVSGARMARYTKTAASWSYAATNGADNTSGTAWSVTGAADPGVASGDIVIVCTGKNSDTPTFSSSVLSQTGVTFDTVTERDADAGSSFGDDIGLLIVDAAVTAGPSSAAPVYTATATANTAGSSVFLRIREVAAAGCTGGVLLLGAGKC